jgi:TM2 domain-containing membrane protein YozV
MNSVLAAMVLAADDNSAWQTFLAIVALLLFIFGVVRIFRGEILWGVLMIVAACLVGPGGVSLLS